MRRVHLFTAWPAGRYGYRSKAFGRIAAIAITTTVAALGPVALLSGVAHAVSSATVTTNVAWGLISSAHAVTATAASLTSIAAFTSTAAAVSATTATLSSIAAFTSTAAAVSTTTQTFTDTLWDPSQALPTGGQTSKVWLRADSNVTQSGTVSAWGDKSGQGNNVSQGTAGSRPSFNATDAAFNNQPSIQSDGTKFMTSAAFSGGNIASPVTIFMVTDVTTLNGGWFIDFGGSGGRTGIITSGTSFQGYSGSFITSSTSVAQVGVIAFVANGASSAMYFNNSGSSIVAGNAGTDGLGSITLFSPNGGGSGIIGRCAEVLIYAGAVAQSDRAAVFRYIANRYAIAAN